MMMYSVLVLFFTSLNLSMILGYYGDGARSPPYWYNQLNCPRCPPRNTVLDDNEIRTIQSREYTAGTQNHVRYSSPYLAVLSEVYGRNKMYISHCDNIVCDEGYTCIAPMGKAHCFLKQNLMNPSHGAYMIDVNNPPEIPLMQMKPTEWEFSRNETYALKMKAKTAGTRTRRPRRRKNRISDYNRRDVTHRWRGHPQGSYG